MTEAELLGTKKGLFVLEGDPPAEFEITTRAFEGQPVDFATRDPRSGRILATVTSPFYGPKIFYTDDPAGEWQQADGVALPEGGEQALERIWVMRGARPTGSLYAGGDPGCCLRARTAAQAGRSTPGCGSSPRARSGSRAVAGCACTRSSPGRETPTGLPWRSRPQACG